MTTVQTLYLVLNLMLLTMTWYRQNMEIYMKIIIDITPQNLL